ncbi:hypothetical protein [Roseibium sp.]|uniref:hypothetical protein n=1 Tax=Roseibium sp. TaxID=1936156 RepID=UPI003D121D8A
MLSLFDRGPFIAFEPSRGVICRCLNVEAAAEALKVFGGTGEIHVDQNFAGGTYVIDPNLDALKVAFVPRLGHRIEPASDKDHRALIDDAEMAASVTLHHLGLSPEDCERLLKADVENALLSTALPLRFRYEFSSARDIAETLSSGQLFGHLRVVPQRSADPATYFYDFDAAYSNARETRGTLEVIDFRSRSARPRLAAQSTAGQEIMEELRAVSAEVLEAITDYCGLSSAEDADKLDVFKQTGAIPNGQTRH